MHLIASVSIPLISQSGPHNAGTTVLISFTYGIRGRPLIADDALSRRNSLALANGTSTTYGYDTANRLLNLQSSIDNRQYTYDNVGNRNTMTDPTGLHTYGYDPLYQLTSADYPENTSNLDETFLYDALGNRQQAQTHHH